MLNKLTEHGRAVVINAASTGVVYCGLASAAFSVLSDSYSTVGPASLVLGATLGGINGLILKEDHELETIKIKDLSRRAYSIGKAGVLATGGYLAMNLATGLQTGSSRDAAAAGAFIGASLGIGSVLGDLNERHAIRDGWDTDSDH